jgi:hypothetical protein
MLVFLPNLETPASSAPVIANLNGTNTLKHGQACTISGLQFTGTPGTITLRQGALSQVQSTGVTWADTSITFTANTAIFAYGAVVLEVTNANGTDQENVTLQPVTGKAYLVADVPWPVGAYSVYEDAAPGVADGDQLEYELVSDNGANVAMLADGTFTLDEILLSHTFAVRVFDQTDKTWSAPVDITVNPVVSIDSVDGDNTVLLGQVSATVAGNNFTGTQGTLTIGGVTQTIQSWTDTLITFIVNPATPTGSRQLTVTNATSSGSISITVASAPSGDPVFNGPTISVPTLTQNAAISPINISARFSDPVGQTLTYSAVGSWPAGVTVTAVSGIIQGVPTVPGTYNGLSVRATDTDGLTAVSNSFSIIVSAIINSQPVFLGPSISVGSITQSTAMTPVNVAARFQDPTGQTLTYSTVGAWPPGVTISPSSGVISGTPTTLGTYASLQVRATDTDGNTVDSNAFTITVVATAVTPPDPTPDPAPSQAGGSALSDVAIANLALTKLGEARIISFSDDTKAARAVAAVYDLLRDAELRRRKWRFTIKRTQLPALAVSPEFGYAYAYQIPADCLSILSVGDVAPGVDLSDYRTGLDMELYSIEGRAILTDLPAPLKLRYKARVTDATQFDAAFVQAFASRLAYELAEDLTQSAAKKQAAGEDYKLAVREAVAANAIEVAPTPIPDDSWLLSRI